ncbi:DUF3578 domain-containing protein [Spirosoma aureum]|uniref:DUF3578 domain-containing protein n=1 Tax=Spirosoma aureum TaxID=2692134 RepID=A0A6G9AKJ3_9BACT|nr:DUF3578 domain-containing protein [Spirosoma aureum]QIP12992.1 DUF3578 domain-containing protein [Spirosoma aureum]
MIVYFEEVLKKYTIAYSQRFTGHPLAKTIRHTLPDIISKFINNDRYLIKGSAGAGNWTIIPWIAIFDTFITSSAQSGYYPVFLFKSDMSGFYLSLNQGVTEIKEKYRKGAKKVLELKAEDYRMQLDLNNIVFKEKKICLTSTNSINSDLASLYESGNIIAKYYPLVDLPTDSELCNDILHIIKAYDSLFYNELISISQYDKESNEENYLGVENLQKIRLHKRIERNAKLVKKVKDIQGYTCKGCGFNFESKYGILGKDFIEAHHLKPLSKLIGEKISLNAQTDFIVLCSNCHSMIHRLQDVSDLIYLQSIINNNFEQN